MSRTPTAAATAEGSARAIAIWLIACAGMVFAMTVIGAITRLTESGLSMVEWRPLIGTLPPLSEAEWQRVFDLYRETPEYRLRNAGMGLEAFKEIFFWEWFHRLWGRLIGVVFVVPLLYFWFTGRIRAVTWMPGLGWRLAGLLALGALQGVLGWVMVLSGLADRPSVSHYRLAAHLGLAVVIYGLLLWLAWRLLAGDRAVRPALAVDRLGWAVVAVVGLTVLWGALVAGLDAGIGFNTWPLMDGALLPSEALETEPPWVTGTAPIPVWQLPFENPTMVQFVHRWLGVAALVVVAMLWWISLRAAVSPGVRRLAALALVVAVVQVGLGVATLLLFVQIPLAAAHQAGALVLLTVLLRFVFAARRPQPEVDESGRMTRRTATASAR